MTNSSFKKTLSLVAYENSFTKDITNDYYLRVKTQGVTLDVPAIAREVARQQGKYKEDEVTLLLNQAFGIIADAVSSGYNVNLPLCLIQPKVKGSVVKNDLSQAPDRTKIKVKCSFRQGKLMSNSLNAAALELYLQPAPVGPVLNGGISTRTVTDDKGAVTRAPLSAGEMCLLTGRNIKLRGTDPTVGILLTSVADKTKTFFISPDRVSPNQPSKLQFVVPEGIADGEWTVKVTTQAGSGNTLVAHPRSYVMDYPLVIGEEGQVEDPTV